MASVVGVISRGTTASPSVVGHGGDPVVSFSNFMMGMDALEVGTSVGGAGAGWIGATSGATSGTYA